MSLAVYTVCYDICSSSRRQPFQQWLAGMAIRLQRSLYLIELEERRLRGFTEKVLRRINPEEDAVWIHRVAHHRPIYTSRPVVHVQGVTLLSDIRFTQDEVEFFLTPDPTGL